MIKGNPVHKSATKSVKVRVCEGLLRALPVVDFFPIVPTINATNTVTWKKSAKIGKNSKNPLKLF